MQNQVLYKDQQKVFLDDIFHELSALIAARPATEKKGNHDDYTFQPAVDDLYFAVDAFDCECPAIFLNNGMLIACS